LVWRVKCFVEASGLKFLFLNCAEISSLLSSARVHHPMVMVHPSTSFMYVSTPPPLFY